MAIVAQLLCFKGTARQAEGMRGAAVELPPVACYPITASGFQDMTMDAEVCWFKNFSTSQTVYVRLNKDADNTAASSTDNQSIGVEAGETLQFGLPIDTDATGYKLSVV